MEKAFTIIVTCIIMLMPFILIGWAWYYMRVTVKLKRSRTGFMNGSRDDFYQAVKSYEKIYSVHTDTSAEAFKEWKRKYGYLNEFLNFNYNKLGLDKDYLKTVRSYQKYMKH